MNERQASPEKSASDENWYGIFYYNAEDDRAIVPKRYGFGWTANFAQPMAYVALGVPLACGIAIATIVWVAKLTGAI